MCTQPRRISAITVSERVAAERGEPLGDAVGYTIRLESKGSGQSAVMFCTNGVLLRMLTGGSDLRDVTHVIVDEIHERDKYVWSVCCVLVWYMGGHMCAHTHRYTYYVQPIS